MLRIPHAARAIMLGALVGSASCGSTLPTAPTPMRIVVSSQSTTNGNRPLHCMVRSVEPAVAMMEDYDQAAVLIFTSDESLLARDVIFPGAPFELSVTLDPTQPIAVYFFFTDPSDGWVVPVPAPVPSRLSIELGANEVVSWSPRADASEDPEHSEAGELTLPPIGGSQGGQGGGGGGGAAPALPAMPQVPEAPTAPTMPGRGR